MGRIMGVVALAAMLLIPVRVLAQGAPAADPKPAPPSFRYVSVFNIDDAPIAYDLAMALSDFDPGAATGERTYLCRAFFTVVEGALVVHEQGAGAISYAAGEKLSLEPGTAASIENASISHARMIMTTLTAPGSPAFQDPPESPGSVPTIAFSGQATVNTPTAPFALNQLIVDFGPGSSSGIHRHNGVGLSIGIAGELTNRLTDGYVKEGVGDTFVDVQDRPTEHRNAGSEVATLVASYLNPIGVPPAVPAALQ